MSIQASLHSMQESAEETTSIKGLVPVPGNASPLGHCSTTEYSAGCPSHLFAGWGSQQETKAPEEKRNKSNDVKIVTRRV